jgi:hypothetical protein
MLCTCFLIPTPLSFSLGYTHSCTRTHPRTHACTHTPPLTSAFRKAQDAFALHPAVTREPVLGPSIPRALHRDPVAEPGIILKCHFCSLTNSSGPRYSDTSTVNSSTCRRQKSQYGWCLLGRILWLSPARTWTSKSSKKEARKRKGAHMGHDPTLGPQIP